METMNVDASLVELADDRDVDALIKLADYHHTHHSDAASVAAALIQLGVTSVNREDFDPVQRVVVCRPGFLHYLYFIGRVDEVRGKIESAPARADGGTSLLPSRLKG